MSLPELRISLPVQLDVLVALFAALRDEFPGARVHHEGSDLVIDLPDDESR